MLCRALIITYRHQAIATRAQLIFMNVMVCLANLISQVEISCEPKLRLSGLSRSLEQMQGLEQGFQLKSTAGQTPKQGHKAGRLEPN